MTREEFDAAVEEYAGFPLRGLHQGLNEERPLSTLEKILVKRFTVPAEEVRGIVVRGIIELLEKEKYKEFRRESEVLTWLVGCLKYTVRQWRREQAKSRERPGLIEGRALKSATCVQPTIDDPDNPGVYKEDGQGERATGETPDDGPLNRDAVQRALATLPEDIQEVVWRVYYKGEGWAEVAADLKVEMRSLQRRVGRYLAPLREQRRSRGEGEAQASITPADEIDYMGLERFIPLERSEPIETVGVPFSQATIEQIKSWVKDWDIDKLVKVFENDPDAIAHPVVRLYVHRLQEVARNLLININWVPASLFPVLPKTSREALTTLTRLGEAWVRGLFPAGWSVRIIPPRGAPKQISELEEWLLLARFNTICRDIDQHADTPLLFGINTTTEPEILIQRVANMVQQIARETIVLEPDPTPDELSGRAKIIPLQIEEALEIARRSIRGKKASKRLLALSVLAYETGKTLKAVESLIERAEANYPELDLRRSKRKS